MSDEHPSHGPSTHGLDCSCTRCRGFQPGNAHAVRHGGFSERLIKARARAHRRRFCRQMGLRLSDMDAIAVAYLDGWARALAKVDQFDTTNCERDPREYFAALNGARLWMAKLEARLRLLGLDTGKGEPSMVAQLQAQARANVVPIAKGKR